MKNYLLGLLMLPLIFNIIVPDAQAGSLAKRMSGLGVYRGGSGSVSPVQDTQPEDMISEEGTREDDQYAKKEDFQYAEKEDFQDAENDKKEDAGKYFKSEPRKGESVDRDK